MPEKPQTVQSPARRPRPEAEELDVSVLYQDEHILVVNKPAGMVVHPTYRNWSGTLLNALLWHVRDRPSVRPSIVTRLDKDTSGLVLAAVTPEVQARIQRDAAGGRVKKEYLAVVRGIPSPVMGTLRMPLARSTEDRRIVVVDAGGAPSETRYEVITPGVFSLLRCELITGRTHQIRVHLSASGWPIAGDAVYGVPHHAISRQALHSWRLTFPHPVTREALVLEAPVAADFALVLDSDHPPSR